MNAPIRRLTARWPGRPSKLCVAIFSLLGSSTTLLAAERAKELVKQVIDAGSWVNRSHTAGHYTVYQDGVDKHPDIVRKFESFLDDRRIHLIRENRQKQPDEQLLLLEVVSTPGRRLVWTKNGSVTYTESEAIVRQAAAFDRAIPDAGYILDAVFALDNEFLVFDVKTASETGKVSDEVTHEVVNGLTCEKVTIKGDTWTFDLWIAPERGFNLAKFRFRCDAKPKVDRRPADFSVDVTSFRQLSDKRWVVDGGVYHSSSPSPSGEKPREWNFKRTLIEVDPDFAANKAFADPPIPDGTDVYVERTDAQGKRVTDALKYVWKDGKPVMGFNSDTIEKLRKRVEEAKQGR